ncbi:MAG: anti-sigma factor [Ornithinimicrobium sp.]
MTPSTAHVHELIGAYALDAVDPDERRVVQEHLRGCERCRLELQQLTEAAVVLSNGYEIEPPPHLKERLMGALGEHVSATPHGSDVDDAQPVRAEQRAPSRRALWGLAAAGLLAVGGWGIWQGVSDELSPIDQVIQAEDARTFDSEYAGEVVTVVASASLDRAVLITEDLPELADDEVYQAWWVNADEQVLSAGVLDDAADAGSSEVALDGDPAGSVAVALSVEPSGGSDQPSGDPVVVVPLQS